VEQLAFGFQQVAGWGNLQLFRGAGHSSFGHICSIPNARHGAGAKREQTRLLAGICIPVGVFITHGGNDASQRRLCGVEGLLSPRG
jgi:hypothetical protein